MIELQAAEDDKRRRIRDARKRAEKAQREAYRDTLRKLAVEGKILPSTRWHSVEDIMAADSSFGPVQAQDQDAPRELFDEFVDEWEEIYRRERSLLSRILHPPSKKEVMIKANMRYEEFTKLLLDSAAYSAELYGETRRIINRDDPVSSARLYFDELILRAKDGSSSVSIRHGSAVHRPADSSEDEGEIVEEGELSEGEEADTSREATRNAQTQNYMQSGEVPDNLKGESDAIFSGGTESVGCHTKQKTGNNEQPELLESLQTSKPEESTPSSALASSSIEQGNKVALVPNDDETNSHQSPSNQDDHPTQPS